MIIRLLLFCVLWSSASESSAAEKSSPRPPLTKSEEETRKSWDAWNAPMKPFRIIGNVYYVGAEGVSSFLVTSKAGHILLDTGFEATVPQIQENISKLGFKWQDIKIILNSHAHLDHAGGDALMKQLTGATLLSSAADAAQLASGGTTDFTPYSTNLMAFPPARADRILKDGQQVTLGDCTLVCHLTPGHTKGATTWTMDAREGEKVYHVLFFSSTSILDGVALVGNAKYPNIAQDYSQTFQKLEQLPCDVFLAPHGSFFGLHEKRERLEHGEKTNPFIDPGAFQSFIRGAHRDFEERLQRERKLIGG
jgi:metallo-beta-lactamase class B